MGRRGLLLRACPAAGPGRGAVRARRHAPVQGRHRRRRRDPQGPRLLRPAHETIYQAILDLYAKGEPADPITVAAELTKRGEITKVGGAPYLHTLVQTVPTAANAEYYAQIVHERAVLRRLVEAGTRITQMGYAADGDIDEIVNSAQAEIFAVTEQRTAEDYLPLSEIMEGALDRGSRRSVHARGR